MYSENYQDPYNSNFSNENQQQDFSQNQFPIPQNDNNQEAPQMHQEQGENQVVERPDESKRILNPFVFDSNSEITISVGEPITKESTLSKHTVYNIKGQDKNGPFDVYRRFNEFYTLKEVLQARWPGCFIPSIPAKEIGSTNQNVVENRSRFLNNFCNQMAKLQHLFYSDEFQQFIRSKETDVTKSLSLMKYQNSSEIIDKYHLLFKEASEMPMNSEYDIRINTWNGFLKKIIVGLKNYKEQMKGLSEMRKELNKTFLQLNEDILPEYEKCLISEYVSNDTNCLIFSNPNNTQFQEFQTKYKTSNDKNPFDFLYDMATFELRDAEAFEESIKQKEELEKKRANLQGDLKTDEEDLNKLNSGKKTVRAVFSSVDEQKRKLESKIELTKVELKNLDNLIEIITKILAVVEIDRFRKEKRLSYHRVLQSVADSEICNSFELMSFWSTVNDCTTILIKN